MIDVLSVVLFISVALVTISLGLYLTNWRTRAVERVAPRRTAETPFLPSPALVWRELVNRVGALVPGSPKDLPRLKRRLLRAGFRSPGAARFFQGVRAVTTVAAILGTLLLGQQGHWAFDNLLYLAGIAGFLGSIAPMQYLKLRIRRRQHAIERGLPNALDLLVICVESGLGLDQATIQVAKELQTAYPVICEEFALVNLEMRAGKRRMEALRNLAERTGVAELKKLVAVLIQTDRFGTSIAQSLRGHADYLRVMARQKAEEQAAKLAVKLVFPIFFCVLPSLFVVTVGPVLTRLIRDLFPMIENM
ncbi:MAG TPA: type II secretion system F family protein [Bryobacteraceae bacterium]|nr:type II secretion system F family protein [Bryobacteraceae bacterium]